MRAIYNLSARRLQATFRFPLRPILNSFRRRNNQEVQGTVDRAGSTFPPWAELFSSESTTNEGCAMAIWGWKFFSRKITKVGKREQRLRRGFALRQRLGFDLLEDRNVPSGLNPNQIIDSSLTPFQLAESLVGTGLSVSNVTFTGGAASTASFNFDDPTVVGFGQGILLSSGSAADVVGPNMADDTSTDFALPGDADLDALSGFTTFDAAVLEFDFIPTANQVVFYYAFASDEYPEWVTTPFNDVFAFYVNGTNYAEVRQIAGDPSAPFVPVTVNNINNGNPLYPDAIPMRPDLFRANYYGSSAIDLELDGITSVLTFQAPVNPGVVNHMKLAIADASDGILDSAVFIQAGSLVSNENPVADLSLTPEHGTAPLLVTAIVEGEDPNGLPLTYTINWGDGTFSNGDLDQPFDDNEKTTLVDHIYASGGEYIVTLTVSNGDMTGISVEDVDVIGVGTSPIVTSDPTDQTVFEGDLFTFSASASGASSVQWQASVDFGDTFVDIGGATATTYSAVASMVDSGNLYQAVFTNSQGSVTSTSALLTVVALDTTPPIAPDVTLTDDTGISTTDRITQVGTLNVTGVETDASVEYSIDGGATWSGSFLAAEGLNTVLVRQTDVAGNVSGVTSFSFTLDTTAPVLNPTFSSPQPFLVNELGISVASNATDEWGVYLQSSGVVDTTSAGQKFVTCTATDYAGNSASASVPFVVGYRAINILPLASTIFQKKASIPISFQLADANGLISDQAAMNLLPNIAVSFDGKAPVSVKYNAKTNTFSVSLKMGKPTAGIHDVFIRVTLDGIDVTTVQIPINVV
jgi:hypothetical protein